MFNPAYLETQVTEHSAQAGIDPEKWQLFMAKLQELKRHSLFEYCHGLRVGLYTAMLAGQEGLDIKFALFAGCGHDIGKVAISKQLLDLKRLTPAQFEEVKAHSPAGFELLKDTFPLTALIAGLHHKFGDNGYGIDLEQAAPFKLPPILKDRLMVMVQLVMVVDFFDAIRTRQNDKGMTKIVGDPDEQRAVLNQYFPDQAQRIDQLFAYTL